MAATPVPKDGEARSKPKTTPRPKLVLTPLDPTTPHPLPVPSTSSTNSHSSSSSTPTGSRRRQTWTPVAGGNVTFSPGAFLAAADRIVLHPELNSSTIMRGDVLETWDTGRGSEEEEEATGPVRGRGEVRMQGYGLRSRTRRKLLPKRTFDHEMEEDCCVFEREVRGDGGPGDGEEEEEEEIVLLLLPDLDLLEKNSEGKVPYYYPGVAATAIRYRRTSLTTVAGDEEGEFPVRGTIRLDFSSLPASPVPTPLPLDHRLYRTALALLRQLNQIACGIDDGYEKRVHHDLLVGKEEVQDLYYRLKEKYSADIPQHDPRITFRWMLKDWKESTDPQKHLWEDVAIASWLIVLWKSMYPETGQPPGGFVDVGCGNGLLVFILSQEGYTGFGIDLRARKSWPSYPPSTDLRTQTLDPTILLTSPDPPFPEGSFLIGNHADELTPWIPLFASAVPGAGFLNIPCCSFELGTKFTRQTYTIPPEFLEALPLPEDGTSPKTGKSNKNQHPLLDPFYAPSPSAAEQSGRYFAYQLYLAHLSMKCGFLPEREALRMPSTKNFGMVGRKRLWEVVPGQSEEQGKAQVQEAVREMVEGVKGMWVARTPEGLARDH
ncbi:DUF1613-domain-containing protein [Meredithblackwellia eburnea MCA 4105]